MREKKKPERKGERDNTSKPPEKQFGNRMVEDKPRLESDTEKANRILRAYRPSDKGNEAKKQWDSLTSEEKTRMIKRTEEGILSITPESTKKELARRLGKDVSDLTIQDFEDSLYDHPPIELEASAICRLVKERFKEESSEKPEEPEVEIPQKLLDFLRNRMAPEELVERLKPWREDPLTPKDGGEIIHSRSGLPINKPGFSPSTSDDIKLRSEYYKERDWRLASEKPEEPEQKAKPKTTEEKFDDFMNEKSK
ncbi:hypothetical protein H0O02_02245 [Candidatus Micrarchaeota archaeon]|nr:hypothetical protein [Candidatus Micrarchaeota archaeon]